MTRGSNQLEVEKNIVTGEKVSQSTRKNALKAKQIFSKILSLKYVMLKTTFVFKDLYLVLFADHHCKRVFYLTCLCSSQSCDNMCEVLSHLV